MIKYIILLSVLLTGCADNLEAIRQDTSTFTAGCKVVNAQAKVGYMGQGGTIEDCKLVCSPKLPAGFTYKYNNNGCSISIGSQAGQ